MDIARSDLALTRTHLAYLHSVADWHHLQARIALSYASLRLGDLVTARMFLAEAESLLARHPDAARCKEQLADLASQLHTARDVLPIGPSSLTTAELRVLHYLPTNLTHQDISERLYVSRNTAKSHASAIYRKLGATSRSEAVEIATPSPPHRRRRSLVDAAHHERSIDRPPDRDGTAVRPNRDTRSSRPGRGLVGRVRQSSSLMSTRSINLSIRCLAPEIPFPAG
jgi:DNA-binding CsgD family transcriptional regulator